jgi:hypothetical protein
VIKAAFLAAFAAAFAFAAATFDAATAARTAMELNEAAQQADDAGARARLLDLAAQALEPRWSAPTRWHAGAIEALSWNKALRAEDAAERALLVDSAAALERGLAVAPIQPNGWLRLAAIRHVGIGGALCDAEQCLERSWLAAEATDPALGCARLRLAHELGARMRADHPRVRAFLATAPDRETLTRCLAFLPAEDLFALLLATPR